MAPGLLATKAGMTQIFTDEGVRVPVTVLQILPNRVVQKKTVETDGYNALQIGYGDRKEKNITKPLAGHMKKANALDGVGPATLREFRVTEEQLGQYNVGDTLGLDALGELTSIDVAGTSKGKGFAGVMKRHNMKGFRATHGTHEYFRHGGSIGCRSEPGRVFKGKRMAGQMGDERVTVLNLNVVQSVPERGLLLVRGAVPGAKSAVLEIRPSSRKANRIPGLKAEQQVQSKNPMKASKAGAGKKK